MISRALPEPLSVPFHELVMVAPEGSVNPNFLMLTSLELPLLTFSFPHQPVPQLESSSSFTETEPGAGVGVGVGLGVGAGVGVGVGVGVGSGVGAGAGLVPPAYAPQIFENSKACWLTPLQ